MTQKSDSTEEPNTRSAEPSTVTEYSSLYSDTTDEDHGILLAKCLIVIQQVSVALYLVGQRESDLVDNDVESW